MSGDDYLELPIVFTSCVLILFFFLNSGCPNSKMNMPSTFMLHKLHIGFAVCSYSMNILDYVMFQNFDMHTNILHHYDIAVSLTDAFDTELLVSCMERLKLGRSC
ncbi:hypothetical protein Syun_024258 [Stephania yunnanensis]|uniref:Uncharacterized protein n=1 Tax=Stephania yunnanensis TaxID=152371 RepID=A0AAP0NHE6_9MAGN